MLELTIDENKFNVCSTWEEITFGQYIDILNIQKDNYSTIEAAVNLFAAISDNKEGCAKALMSLSQSDFEELNDVFDFTAPNYTAYTATTSILLIDGKTYKVKENYHKLTMGEMSSMELLIQNNKSLDINEIAFGILLRELDEQGNEKPFSDEAFYEVVTKLRDKVLLKDIYQHLLFFSSGEKKHTKTTKGFSIRTV